MELTWNQPPIELPTEIRSPYWNSSLPIPTQYINLDANYPMVYFLLTTSDIEQLMDESQWTPEMPLTKYSTIFTTTLEDV